MVLTQALFVVTGIAVWAAGAFAWSRVTGGIIRPSITSLFFLFYTVLVYIGAWVVFFRYGMDNLWFPVAVAAPLLLMPAGAAIANVLLRYDPAREMREYLARPLTADATGEAFVVPFALLCVLGIAAGAWYLQTLGYTPLALLVSGTKSIVQITQLRNQDTTTLGGAAYGRLFGYFDGVMQGVLPFVALVAYSKWLESKKPRWIGITIALSLLTAYFVGNTLVKNPLLLFLVMFVVCTYMVRGRVPRGWIFVALVISMVYLGVYYVLLLQGGSTTFALQRGMAAVADRLIIVYPDILHLIMNTFPTAHPFLSGASLPNPHGIFGFESINLGILVYTYYRPIALVVGNAPTTFYSEAYANFGLFGMFLSMPVVGFLLQVVQVGLIRTRKTALSVAMSATLCVYLGTVAYSFLFGVLLSWYVILIVVSFLLLRLSMTLMSERRTRAAGTSIVTHDGGRLSGRTGTVVRGMR